MSDSNEYNLLGASFAIASISRLPNLAYNLQKFKIPGVFLPNVEVPNPLTAMSVTGDHLTYESLEMEFKVDEGLVNYFELYKWIIQTGFPKSYEQRRQLTKKVGIEDSVYTDIDIVTLSSKRNPVLDITFHDVHPIHLGGFEFVTTNSNTDYISAFVRFKFTNFSVKARNSSGTSKIDLL
jgi:hypothetical protein